MKSTRSLLRFIVPLLFVTLVGGFVANNSGLFSCSERGNTIPELPEPTWTKKDSIIVFPESKAKDTLANPFPDRLSESERQIYFSSSKSAGTVIPFDQLPFGNRVDDRPVRIMEDGEAGGH